MWSGHSLKTFLQLACAVVALCPASAYAVDVVRTPIVNPGNFQFDYKGKYQSDANPRQDDVQEEDFGVGYGITDRWRSRLESEFVDNQGKGLDYKYISWANTVSLTGNDSPLPTAIFTNVAFANHAYISNYVTAGLASQKVIGPTTNTANLFLKHEFGDGASGKPSLLYRLQSKYNIYSYLSPGVELFGDTNKQDAMENQILKVGPGLFGTFNLGTQRVGYELVYLRGATTATPDNTLKWRLSYTFQ
jgi:hypothetical protein